MAFGEPAVTLPAVRRGTRRALVSCDVPQGPVWAGTEAAVAAALRLAKEGGADRVMVLGDPAVVKAVSVPVIGGLGGGPCLDGRVRLAHTAIGYGAKWIDSRSETYVNTARQILQAFTALADDVRSGRQIKGE